MKELKVLFATASCFLLLSPSSVCTQTSVRATTEDGKQVILRGDGTWQYANPESGQHTKSATATTKLKAPFGDFVLWVDPAKWRQTKDENPGELYFRSVDGMGYAKVITDKIPLPLTSLKEAALENAKTQDPNARIVSEEDRIVNGHHVLCMQMEVSKANLSFEFYGYYYGGSSGAIQSVTWTLKDAFAANKSEFTEFLDGLEINDNLLQLPAPDVAPIPSVPVVQQIELNGGKLVISYDARKWKQQKSDDPNRPTFALLRGGGYAMAVVEKLAIPTDSLPDIALSNARNAAPDAKIISQEKRVVSGTLVWCLKIQGTLKGIPFEYYGYYYGGKAGTIQLITYTGSSLFEEYQKDFTEFLNGLQIKE